MVSTRVGRIWRATVVVGAVALIPVVNSGPAYADVSGRVVVTSSFTVQPGSGWDAVAACPAGKVSTGGGHSYSGVPDLYIDISTRATNTQGWRVHAVNYSTIARTITAYAICATSG